MALSSISSIAIVGVSFRTLPTEGREQFSLIENDLEGLLKGLRQFCGADEVIVLSTCNRFEVVSVGVDDVSRIILYLESRIGQKYSADVFYTHRDADAVRHLMRVVGSLDSMVLGEAQILGQVKQAYTKAVEVGTVGKLLHRLFQYSFHLAKRIRSDTGVAENGVSLSYIAVKLTEQIFGSLKGRGILVIGSGEMAELATVHLLSYGCDKIVIANRTVSRARELAERFGGTAIGLPDIPKVLPDVEVVIGSISSPQPILTAEHFSGVHHKSATFLIDLGMPRNFSADIGGLEDVYLYNIDDLAGIAEENRTLREEAAGDAEVIVEYGVFQYQRWLDRVALEPQILAVKRRIQELCLQELSGDVDDQNRSRLAGRLSGKIFHELTSIITSGKDNDAADPDTSSSVADSLKLSIKAQ